MLGKRISPSGNSYFYLEQVGTCTNCTNSNWQLLKYIKSDKDKKVILSLKHDS